MRQKKTTVFFKLQHQNVSLATGGFCGCCFSFLRDSFGVLRTWPEAVPKQPRRTRTKKVQLRYLFNYCGKVFKPIFKGAKKDVFFGAFIDVKKGGSLGHALM